MNELGRFGRRVSGYTPIAATGVPPIAVVGIGCRFPGASGPDEYWKMILNGGCGIGEVPDDRWSSSFFDPNPDAIYKSRSKWGGFIKNYSDFDPAFFDISPAETSAIDPQQRILLEVACETVEDAGFPMQALRNTRTGVFVGISMHDFASVWGQSPVNLDIWAGTGKANSIAANRISHRLDLTGPSMAIDTACSSSLVAIAQACQNLATGTCDMALAGGVNCMLEPTAFVLFSRANMLSPTGSVYTFDARANGFVRGEGCGLVLLKRADAAIADGDRIYAIISGTSVNQDGHTSTLTAPNPRAQYSMLQSIIEQTGIEPAAIGYVEAHGTGTPIGDPIEARAIGRAIGRLSTVPLLVGSVKPNIGHLESAAAAAGFIKAALAIHHGIVPPNINFETPNPYIAFDALNLKVPVEPTSFPDTGTGARIAVVNSFGFGGTNASTCLRQNVEPPTRRRTVQVGHLAGPLVEASDEPVLVPLSAPTHAHLALWAGQVADFVEAAKHSVHDIAQALSNQYDHMAERVVVISSDNPNDLAENLRTLAAGPSIQDKDAARSGDIVLGRSRSERQVVFTFSGQGTQWRGMARHSLASDRSFRAAVENFDSILQPLVGWSVYQELLNPSADFDRNDITQASIFAVQYGLAAMWQDRGVIPGLVLGHSLGEVAAAVVARAISLEAAAKILSRRGLIRNKSPIEGAMAAVGLPAEEIIPLLPADESVLIGAFNGPASLTLTGARQSLDRLLETLQSQFPGAFVRRLNVDFAWHSVLLDYGKDWFHSEVGEVAYQEPEIPFISTVTGKLHNVFDLAYWWQNLRRPVDYRKAVESCIDLGFDAFLELGPQITITPLTLGVTRHRSSDAISVPTLERNVDDRKSIARATAVLHVNGVKLHLNQDHDAAPLALPKREWIHQDIYPISIEHKVKAFNPVIHPLLGRREFGPIPTWSNEFSLKAYRYLAGHRVHGDCLFPAAGYIEMIIAAISAEEGHGPVELRDLALYEALSLGEDDYFIFRTQYDPKLARVSVYVLKRDENESWRLCAASYAWRRDFKIEGQLDYALMDSELTLNEDELYDLFDRHGLQYSGAFRLVDRMWISADGKRSIAKVRLQEEAMPSFKDYFVCPPFFDAFLQSQVPMKTDIAKRAETHPVTRDIIATFIDCKLSVPIGIKRVLFGGAVPREALGEYRAASAAGNVLDTLTIFDQDERPVLLIEQVFDSPPIELKEKAENLSKPSTYREYFEKIDDRLLDNVTADPDHRWLAIVDSPTTLTPTIAALEGMGIAVHVISVPRVGGIDGDLIKAFTSRLHDADRIAGVLVDFSMASVGELLNPTTAELLDQIERCTFRLVTLGKALDANRAEKDHPLLVVVTRQARSVPGDGPMPCSGLAASSTIGLVRTIANECPEYRIRQIDADDVALEDGQALARASLAALAETEFVLRGKMLWVPRLERVSLNELVPTTRTVSSEDTDRNYYVTMSRPGLLENLVLREAPKPDANAGEIVVEVAAVGLNFRDIMAATSILPDELEGDDAWWNNLGLEFSGVVSSVGEAVSDLKVGDRVMGMGRGLLRRYARVAATTVTKVPPHIDLSEAAAIPTTFMTAYYGLEYLGRLSRGEKALIHLASGGVGLAAIQVAQTLGAEIFATAGSETKRDYLCKLGIKEVMNSRTLEFASQVMAATRGEGVDVVLNSLSGAAIDKSLECLAPFGRFIEIGKRDLADDKPIGLKSLYYNNSYSVVDLAAMASEKPELLRRLIQTVTQRLAEGIYKPIPTRCFPVSDVKEAFRFLASAQQIGKVVVTFDLPKVEVEFELKRSLQLSPNASYLVTGGLRGLGARVADWMSESGAGRLLLVSRSGVADAEVTESLERMRARGTEVEAIALDMIDSDAVGQFVTDQLCATKPLRGIVHGAAVIEDGFLQQLDDAKIRSVLHPKVAGAWNLHRALEAAGGKVDFFVSFSSVAPMIGSPGQGNYVAANSFLEAFSQFRRDRDQPAMAVGWGPIGGSGFVARSEALSAYMESSGFKLVSDSDAVEMLGRYLRTNATHVVYAGVDWNVGGRALASIASSMRYRPLLSQQASGTGRLFTELSTNSRKLWPELIERALRIEVAKILKVDSDQIELGQKLSEAGLDSLSSFQLKNRVEALLDITIPIAKFVQSPSVTGLSLLIAATLDAKIAADNLRSKSGEGSAGAGSGVAETPAQLLRQVEALTIGQRAMSSPELRDGLEFEDSIELIGPNTLELARACLESLAERHPILCLHAETDELTEQKWWAGELELVVSDGINHNSQRPPAALWAFELIGFEGGCKLVVRAHRAAADAVSVAIIIGAVEEAVRGKPMPEASLTFESFARARGLGEDSVEVTHRTFWEELIDRMPRAAFISGRRRVLTPAALGFDRAKYANVSRRFDARAWQSAVGVDREPILLLSFARGLVAIFDLGSTVIERHDPSRRDSGPADIIGPVSDAVPVLIEDPRENSYQQVRTTLTMALTHRDFDSAAIDTTLQQQLRQKGVVLRQFGFSYVDAGVEDRIPGFDPEDAVRGMPPYNEIRFDLVERTGDIVARLTFDTDILSQDVAERLLDRIVASMPEALGVQPLSFDGISESGAAREPVALSVNALGATIRPTMGLAPIPINMRQDFLLRTVTRPSATLRYRDYWTNTGTFINRPSVDVDRLRLAFHSVLRRHESLRTRFEPTATGFNAFVEANFEPDFTVEEVARGDEASLRRRLVELDEISIDPLCEAPCALTVVRCPGFGDAIHTRFHHVAVDSWSIGILIDELFRAYIGLTLPKPELSVSDFVRIYDRFGDHTVMSARENYFREALRNSPPIPNFDRARRRNLPNLSGAEVHRSSSIIRTLSRKDRDLLGERARKNGFSVGFLLMAAMGQTLARRGDVDEINLMIPLAARLDARLTNFVGWVANNPVVRCRAAAFPLVDGLAQDMALQVRNALPHMPADFTLQHGLLHDQLCAQGSYMALYESGEITPRAGSTWSPSQALQQADGVKVIDFGSFKLEPIVAASPLREGFREFDLRTFDKGDHLAIRCGYDRDVFGPDEAAEIVAEILDRVELLDENRGYDVLQPS